MQVMIAELKLDTEEKGYVVGFRITLDNGAGFYVDAVVPLSELDSEMSEEDIVVKAWRMRESRIYKQKEDAEKKSMLLGQQWTPPRKEQK